MTWRNTDGLGKLLARVGGKPQKVIDKVGLFVEDLGTRRGKHVGVGDLFQGGGSGGSSLRVGDVVDYPPYGPSPGDVPEQGGP